MASETRNSARDYDLSPALPHRDSADRALANALPQVIWTCNAEGRLEWVNDRWFELTGMTEEETLNDKGALVAVHPDDRAELGRRWGHALATATAIDIEYRIRNTAGEYRWHVGRVGPVKDASGTVTRWVAGVFDMHDRHVAEEEARAFQRRFETIFHLSPQPLTITRQADGTFLDINAAFVELTGYTREDAIGKSSVELGMWTGETRAAFIEGASHTPGRTREISVRAKGGRIIDVMLSNAPVEINGVPCFVNSSPDITARRANENALRESEARARARADELATLMDAVPAVVWVSRDNDCREILGNRAGHEALRMAMGQNLSKTADNRETTRHFSIFVNGTELPPDQLPLHRAARGEELRNVEEEVRFDDGHVTHLLGSAVPLRDPDGAPRGAIGAFLDVTRLKRAEEALRTADRRKDEFLALLSHELRNPLTPILTSARLLQRQLDADARHDADVIVRQVKHLVRLVDDLLDVSRVARGKVSLSMKRLELATAVSHAIEATATLFEERGHHLEIRVPAEGLAIDADEVRLTQVVDNLLSNAARYTPPGGTITVTGARDADSVVVRVRDTGIGIDPALLPDLFEPLVQGARGLDRAQGGLGIGLSLVRALTELHGGTVTAHSDGLGRGSEFVVRLPAAAEADRAAQPAVADSSVRAQSARKARVLLVDDHQDVLDGMARLLSVVGYEVRTALDPLSAISLAETFRPQIAILDIGLPVMDGYALARELRSRLSDAPPLLIALSGYSQTQDRERSDAAGFVAHLVKPNDMEQLVDMLDRFVADGATQTSLVTSNGR